MRTMSDQPKETLPIAEAAPLAVGIKDLLAAVTRLIAANHALGKFSENRVTYYEESPIKNPECCRRWEELNAALAEAKKAANASSSATPQAGLEPRERNCGEQ